ncbi:hypothetical protein BBJ28_00025985 [Nothophytophthora sp. Chile5]|nr:hypothetical protein BBJ28_00025985 [Nothophytophthora sp. Chile5]
MLISAFTNTNTNDSTMETLDALFAEGTLIRAERLHVQTQRKVAKVAELAAKETELVAKDKTFTAKKKVIIAKEKVIMAKEKAIAAAEATLKAAKVVMAQREREAELTELLNEKNHSYILIREQEIATEFERLRVATDGAAAGINQPE